MTTEVPERGKDGMDAYFSMAYLAPVEYYAMLMASDRCFIERYDSYMKQTYRNRCFIAGPEGRQILTVPVEKSDSPKCLMKDVRISDHGNWRHLHLTALESAYGNTPYFEFYRDDFVPFYERKFEFLADFDMELCRMVCRLLDIEPDMRLTDEYKTAFGCGEHDFREVIHPKKDYREADAEFRPAEYYQVFGRQHGFIPNLSIVDLLFNMGPESVIVLKKSIVPHA